MNQKKELIKCLVEYERIIIEFLNYSVIHRSDEMTSISFPINTTIQFDEKDSAIIKTLITLYDTKAEIIEGDPEFDKYVDEFFESLKEYDERKIK